MRTILTLLWILFWTAPAGAELVREQGPDFFTFDELMVLSTQEELPSELNAKLATITTTPFINNEAHFRGVKPVRPVLNGLGPSLRVVMWNIERGLRMDQILLMYRDKEAFLKQADIRTTREYRDLIDELEIMRTADVLVFQEVDWGMKRTGYRSVIRELGEALQMNWAYGVEFVEVDPTKLGIEEFEEAPADERKVLKKESDVDRSRYLGLHGTAILSRYPIRNAELQPFTFKAYDWYHDEKERVSELEKGKRAAAEKVLLEKTLREVRQGGRTMLTVTLEFNEIPEGQITVIAPHLENRCKPSSRRKQMEEVLSRIHAIRNPVILAGDLNTHMSDAMPTNLKREIYKRVGSVEFWAKQGIKWATGLGLLYDVTTGGVNVVKNHNDPTAKNVPVVAPNPERELFDELEESRSVDGKAFDFRGNASRMVNDHEGTLGNSNQRAGVGFTPTYETQRTIGSFGEFKLDWILIRSHADHPDDGPYRLAPHFARNLQNLNYVVPDRISDHNAISTDLPLTEPAVEALQLPHAPQQTDPWSPKPWTLSVKHKHFPIGSCKGKLTLSKEGLTFQSGKKSHSGSWTFSEMDEVRRDKSSELEMKLPREEDNKLQRVTGNDLKFEIRNAGISRDQFRSLAEYMRLAEQDHR